MLEKTPVNNKRIILLRLICFSPHKEKSSDFTRNLSFLSNMDKTSDLKCVRSTDGEPSSLPLGRIPGSRNNGYRHLYL